jgi:hypothetical protein
MHNKIQYTWRGSRDSVAGITTRYGLEVPGTEFRWGEIFRTYPNRLRGPPSLLYNGYRVFLGSKGGRGVMLTTQPLLVPRLRKSWALPPLTLWVLLGLLRGSIYPLLHFTWGLLRVCAACPNPRLNPKFEFRPSWNIIHDAFSTGT